MIFGAMSRAEDRDRPTGGEGAGLAGEGDSWSDLSLGPQAHGPGDVRGAEQRSSHAASPIQSTRLRGLRLLVVDSSPQRIDAAREALEAVDIEVASGGPDESGYLRALEFRPDAVLSDLTTPGEPGWWLFQRFRRQPLLKWMPVLLMRWWEDAPGGEPRVLVSRVVERIGEVLAPIRVIEERIAAGRALADRIEVTGIPALLKLLARADLSGALSINDSWNVFEAIFVKGRLAAVSRRGVDGEADVEQEALVQLLLCDSGRWSFRTLDPAQRPENIGGDLSQALDAAGGLLSSVFGPASSFRGESGDRVGVRLNVMRDVASSLSSSGRPVVEALAAGASAAELDGVVRVPAELVGAERALVSLMRCGAVRPFGEVGVEERPESERRVAAAVAYMLAKIAEDHRAPATESLRTEGEHADGDQPVGQAGGRGYYRVSQVMAERVALRARESMSVPGVNIHPGVGRIDLTPAESVKLQFEAGAPTPVLEPDSAAWAAGLSSTVDAGDGSAPRVMPHDSLVPGPPLAAEDRGRRQMLLALALALLLGGLLVIGLVVIGSDTPEPRDEVQGP
jgi:hypothetical protein